MSVGVRGTVSLGLISLRREKGGTSLSHHGALWVSQPVSSVTTHTLAAGTMCAGICRLSNDFVSPVCHGSTQATEVSRYVSDRDKGHPYANQYGLVANNQRGHPKPWPTMVSWRQSDQEREGS